MANRFFSPNQKFADTTGLPYAGYYLGFYASGTSTPLATYSNRALTIANINPVLLDSAGRAGDIFLQNLAYKVILSSDLAQTAPVWTADPVYSSDFSTTASFLSGAGSPNGVVAGSQGSPTVPASVYWDTTNNILYVCTTTGTTLTAVWTAVNASTAASVVPAPQGYLTPVSNTPVITVDSIAATTIFYTPYVGNLVPIYNGSSFAPTVFTELSLSLVSSHTASNIYDVFVFNNSGVPTLVTGPTWSAGTSGSITAGSCARGTGAGGTSLGRVNGILTNGVQITGRNGATTYTINANLATYVGSLFIDGTNGQVTCHRAFGQSRKWGIWNAYNRISTFLKIGDPNATFAAGGTAGGTLRPTNNNSANSGTIFTGLAEEKADCAYHQTFTAVQTAGVTVGLQSGIGYNSTTAASGSAPQSSIGSSASASTLLAENVARFIAVPSLGINVITALEGATASGPTSNGTEKNCSLMAVWQA